MTPFELEQARNDAKGCTWIIGDRLELHFQVNHLRETIRKLLGHVDDQAANIDELNMRIQWMEPCPADPLFCHMVAINDFNHCLRCGMKRPGSPQ